MRGFCGQHDRHRDRFYSELHFPLDSIIRCCITLPRPSVPPQAAQPKCVCERHSVPRDAGWKVRGILHTHTSVRRYATHVHKHTDVCFAILTDVFPGCEVYPAWYNRIWQGQAVRKLFLPAIRNYSDCNLEVISLTSVTKVFLLRAGPCRNSDLLQNTQMVAVYDVNPCLPDDSALCSPWGTIYSSIQQQTSIFTMDSGGISLRVFDFGCRRSWAVSLKLRPFLSMRKQFL